MESRRIASMGPLAYREECGFRLAVGTGAPPQRVGERFELARGRERVTQSTRAVARVDAGQVDEIGPRTRDLRRHVSRVARIIERQAPARNEQRDVRRPVPHDARAGGRGLADKRPGPGYTRLE